jgi:Ala-tRNA(Pro) deacylase
MESEDAPMLANSLKNYLDERKVNYETITHTPAFTASGVAQAAHIPGAMLAKTVMIYIDRAMAMAVLPANHRVLLDDLRDLTGTDDVHLAHEDDFKRRFPDCEEGAMPPFGNLYGMPTYVAPSLAAQKEIAFNAGSHTEIIKMSWADYERLVAPLVLGFTN